MGEEEASKKAQAGDGEPVDGTPMNFDPALERWLREEVVPAAIELERDPSRAIPLEKVKEELARLHQRHTSGTSNDE